MQINQLRVKKEGEEEEEEEEGEGEEGEEEERLVPRNSWQKCPEIDIPKNASFYKFFASLEVRML